MGCPYNFTPGEKGGNGAGGGSELRNSLVLRGLAWLVTEAVACDFEDSGKDYMASARKVRVVIVRVRQHIARLFLRVPLLFIR